MATSSASAPSTTMGAILSWCNDLLCTDFAKLDRIPAKAAARLLNAAHGNEKFPMSELSFDDTNAAVRLKNCSTVLTQSKKLLGFSGKLEPIAWLKESDFANTLIFWRWVRLEAHANPIPANKPLSLEGAVGAGVGHSASHVLDSSLNNSNILLSESMTKAVGTTAGGNQENAEGGDAVPASARLNSHVQLGATLATLDPNRRTTTTCADCGQFSAQLTATTRSNVEYWEQLRVDLLQATKEQDTAKVMRLFALLDAAPTSSASAPGTVAPGGTVPTHIDADSLVRSFEATQ